MAPVSRSIGFSGALLASLFLQAPAAADEAPRLSLPIACEPGKTCFIQSYVDMDSGPGSRDFACGAATYEGHKGTDFRLLSTERAQSKVAVLASADGTIKGGRDGMPDVFARQIGLDALKGRECGNGVVIDHGQGWETQYCHMLKGSVATKPGDRVKRGQRLGDVGYSGQADFAHVHLEIRHNGKTVDPFSGLEPDSPCSAEAASKPGLWDEPAVKAFAYANGQIIQAAFSGALPNLDALEVSDSAPPPTRTSGQLVFFVRMTNLRAGDRIRVSINGPDGFAVDNTSEPLDRNKATFLSYAGKKLTAAAWPRGRYKGAGKILRGETVVTETSAEVDLTD